MFKIFDRITRVILIIVGLPSFASSLYQFIRGVESVMGPITISPAGWIFISGVSGLITVFAGAHYLRQLFCWINSKTPSQKFKSLSSKINDCKETEDQIHFINLSKIDGYRILLQYELKMLGIRTPDVHASHEAWVSFLARIYPLAKNGHVKTARKLKF